MSKKNDPKISNRPEYKYTSTFTHTHHTKGQECLLLLNINEAGQMWRLEPNDSASCKERLCIMAFSHPPSFTIAELEIELARSIKNYINGFLKELTKY